MVLCNTPNKTVLPQVYLEEDIDLTVRRVDYPNGVGIVLSNSIKIQKHAYCTVANTYFAPVRPGQTLYSIYYIAAWFRFTL